MLYAYDVAFICSWSVDLSITFAGSNSGVLLKT